MEVEWSDRDARAPASFPGSSPSPFLSDKRKCLGGGLRLLRLRPSHRAPMNRTRSSERKARSPPAACMPGIQLTPAEIAKAMMASEEERRATEEKSEAPHYAKVCAARRISLVGAARLLPLGALHPPTPDARVPSLLAARALPAHTPRRRLQYTCRRATNWVTGPRRATRGTHARGNEGDWAVCRVD